MGWTVRGSNSGKDKRFFRFQNTSWPALGPNQPPIQWVPVFLPGGRATGTGCWLLPSSVRLRMSGAIHLLPLYVGVDREKVPLPLLLCLNSDGDQNLWNSQSEVPVTAREFPGLISVRWLILTQDLHGFHPFLETNAVTEYPRRLGRASLSFPNRY